MSAPEVTEAVLKEIARDYYDLIILNFANPDMVGHTGNFDATVKALETLDGCLKKIVETLESKKAKLLITADHGNAERMLDENNAPATAHSLNKVPLIYIGDDAKTFNPAASKTAKLADIAPTLLAMMGLAKPEEMTGINLLD
jgi:2,3-bisphosphoglycerate-independent phosphoglycerate mutase